MIQKQKSLTGESFQYSVGDAVGKQKGYSFNGEVRACFHNKAGAARYVVELDDGNGGGMLHIFNANQLSHRRNPEL